jgi:hypothetical protein
MSYQSWSRRIVILWRLIKIRCDEFSTCDRQSFERIQALLPQDDKELDALTEQFLADNAINDFGFIVLAALGSNRPVDARHLVRGASLLIDSGWLMEIALRMQGNVARHLLQALDTQPFGPEDTALILLIAAVWSRERGLAPSVPASAGSRRCR